MEFTSEYIILKFKDLFFKKSLKPDRSVEILNVSTETEVWFGENIRYSLSMLRDNSDMIYREYGHLLKQIEGSLRKFYSEHMKEFILDGNTLCNILNDGNIFGVKIPVSMKDGQSFHSDVFSIRSDDNSGLIFKFNLMGLLNLFKDEDTWLDEVVKYKKRYAAVRREFDEFNQNCIKYLKKEDSDIFKENI